MLGPNQGYGLFNIASMVTHPFTGRLDSEPILPMRVNLMVAVMDTGTETVCVNRPLMELRSTRK